MEISWLNGIIIALVNYVIIYIKYIYVIILFYFVLIFILINLILLILLFENKQRILLKILF